MWKCRRLKITEVRILACVCKGQGSVSTLLFLVQIHVSRAVSTIQIKDISNSKLTIERLESSVDEVQYPNIENIFGTLCIPTIGTLFSTFGFCFFFLHYTPKIGPSRDDEEWLEHFFLSGLLASLNLVQGQATVCLATYGAAPTRYVYFVISLSRPQPFIHISG